MIQQSGDIPKEEYRRRLHIEIMSPMGKYHLTKQPM